MKLKFSLQIFEKYSTIKFHKNPSVIAELLHADRLTDGQTSVTKLIVAVRNFSTASNKYQKTKCLNTSRYEQHDYHHAKYHCTTTQNNTTIITLNAALHRSCQQH